MILIAMLNPNFYIQMILQKQYKLFSCYFRIAKSIIRGVFAQKKPNPEMKAHLPVLAVITAEVSTIRMKDCPSSKNHQLQAARRYWILPQRRSYSNCSHRTQWDHSHSPLYSHSTAFLSIFYILNRMPTKITGGF